MPIWNRSYHHHGQSSKVIPASTPTDSDSISSSIIHWTIMRMTENIEQKWKKLFFIVLSQATIYTVREIGEDDKGFKERGMMTQVLLFQKLVMSTWY